MNKLQRKKHFRTWAVLAILLPLGIIAARIVVPGKTADKLIQTPGSDSTEYINSILTGKQSTDSLNNKQ